MASISDLKKAIRRGDSEMVEEIARELHEDGVDLSSALDLAKNLNCVKNNRGGWSDIVEILEEFC